MKATQSKKGATFLDVMVSLVVLMSFTGMMVSATQFMANSQQQIRQGTHFNQVVHNRVMQLYDEPEWDELEDEEVETPDGIMVIRFDHNGINNAYQTDSLTVDFTLGDAAEQLNLERSVYIHD